MWVYEQVSGKLSLAGKLIGVGYSGCGEGKNKPAFECIPDVGPIPRGRYQIGAAFSDPEKGPLVMRLTPELQTETFSRDGFEMHGDSLKEPGNASLGCIVIDHSARLQVAESAGRILWVV